MKKWILAGLVVLFGLCGLAEVRISNFHVAQRPGTKLVDITYDVSSMTATQVWVSLSVSNGASAVSATSLSGDVSFGLSSPISIGTGKSIVWDTGVDVNGLYSEDISYALKADETPPPPPQGMVQIPAGTNSGTDPDFGAYSLTVEAFYMDETEVTKAQWDEVYNWAITRGYSFDRAGSGKAANHPVHSVNWYDCVKWCNARSEKEERTPVYTVSGNVYRTGQSSPMQNTSANGYRLPTVVEWEYAARGGLSGKRFPWGDTIQHTRANYQSSSSYSYDTSSTRGYHPSAGTTSPRTMAVKSFAANGYGLYDVSGNVWEWCWDASGSDRDFRGGSWSYYAYNARCGYAYWHSPVGALSNRGFRAVCR